MRQARIRRRRRRPFRKSRRDRQDCADLFAGYVALPGALLGRSPGGPGDFRAAWIQAIGYRATRPGAAPAGNRFEIPQGRAPRSPGTAASALSPMADYSDSRRAFFLPGLHLSRQSRLHFGNDRPRRDVRWRGARQTRAPSFQTAISFKRSFKEQSGGATNRNKRDWEIGGYAPTRRIVTDNPGRLFK